MSAGQTIADAYVQILPSTKGIKNGIAESLGGAGIGQQLGGSIMGALKKVLVGGAVVKLFKDAIGEGAKLQQSMGGVETLFGAGGKSLEEYAQSQGKSVDKVAGKYAMLMQAQNAVMANAGAAWKTAGLSANGYMETVTGFAAALKRSTKTEADAARIADMAVIDMADNANKMGTDMESIQMAYQGFAKQNYTMLDNLKLGYGGTKSEMKRLLKDAGKITGKKYNLNNLADVYEAIHVIQGELGITGTTAEEAEKTLTGSFNAMKAAAQNLLGKLALGEDIGPALADLTKSAGTFLFGNLVPMILNVFKSAFSALPSLVPALGDFIINGVKSLASYDWSGLGSTIVTGIQGAFGTTGDWLKKVILGENYSDESTWANVGTAILNGTKSGIQTAMGTAADFFKSVFGLGEGEGSAIDSAFSGLGSALFTRVQQDASSAFAVFTAGKDALLSLFGMTDTEPGEAWGNFGKAIWEKIKGGFEASRNLIGAGAALLKTLILGESDGEETDWQSVGTTIWNGIKSGISTAVGVLGEWVKGLLLGDSYTYGTDWESVGTTIWTGIKTGISTAVGALGAWLKQLVLGESYTDGASWESVGTVIWTNVKSGITTAVGSVGTWLKQLVLGESYTDGASWESVGSTIWANVKSGISTAVGTLGTWLKQLVLGESYTDGASWESVGTAIWTSVKTGISTAVGAVGSWLSSLLGADTFTAGEGFTAMGGAVWEAIKNGFTASLNVLKAGGDLLLSLLGLNDYTPGEALQGVGGAIWEGIKTGFSNALSLVTSAGGWLFSLLGLDSWSDDGTADGVGQTLANALKGGVDTVFGVGEAAGQFLSGAFQSAYNTIQAIDWGGVGSTILSGLQGALDGIASIAGGIWDGIKSFFGGGEEENPAVDWADGVETAMAQSEPILQASAQALGESATAALNEQFSEEDGRNLFANLAQGIRLEALETDFTADIQGVTTQIANLFMSLQNWNEQGKKIGKGIADGVAAKKNDVSGKVKAAIDAAKSKAGSEIGMGGSKFKKYGKDIASGIAAGVTENKGKVSEALIAAFDDAIEELKRALGINSPSRVFANEIGRWIPPGIALGVKKYAYEATDAMLALARDMTDVGSAAAAIPGDGSVPVRGGFVFNQTVNSPRALSPMEVARQARNAARQMAEAMV